MPDSCPQRNNTSQFQHKTIWSKDDDTDLKDYRGGSFPKKLLISLSTVCNLNCKHCSFSPFPRHGILMPKEMIDHITEDFFDQISWMQIGGNGVGEPMTSPHFNYFLEKVREKSFGVELITNGTFINNVNAALIAQKVSRIHVSVEGVGENYEAIRGRKWSELENYLRMLVEAREKSGKTPALSISLAITVLREYREDSFKLADFAKKIGINCLNVRNFYPIYKDGRPSSFLYYPREHNRYFSELFHYANQAGLCCYVPTPIPSLKKSFFAFVRPRRQCNLPFEVFGIYPDGLVHPCCTLCLNIGSVSEIDLGYYKGGKDNVRQLWTSRNYINLRKKVNSYDPPRECKTCEKVNTNPLKCRPRVFPNKNDPGKKG